MANGSSAKAPAAASGGEGFFTRLSKGKAGRFLTECKIETIDKASWPTKQELTSFTIIVLVALVVVGAFIGILDSVLTYLTSFIG